MTPWTAATEGHMIVVEPNGTTQAWPAYDQPDLFLYLGNLLEEPVTAIWDRYPYQASHYAKYLGRSIYTATRTARPFPAPRAHRRPAAATGGCPLWVSVGILESGC
jgi:hypothetical protein